MATIGFASVALQVDDPETPFNEADTPSALELALPTSLGVNLVRPTVDSVDSIILPIQSTGWLGLGVDNSVHRHRPGPKQVQLDSLQNLLSVFLI